MYVRDSAQLVGLLKVKYLKERKDWFFSLRFYTNVVRSFAKRCAMFL